MSGCATSRQSVRQSRQFPFGGGIPPSTVPLGPSEAMGPPEAFGPVPPIPGPSYGPDPVKLKSVVLVLGPGLARGYAYVGVLQALKEAKISVGAILGTEVGGFIGAMYCLSGSMNSFEWGLMKFKEDSFVEKKGFLSKSDQGPSDGNKFERQLRQIFGKKDLKQLKIPFKTVFRSQETGALIVVGQGPAVEAVRSTMAAPGLFLSGVWPIREAVLATVSAGQSRPFLVEEGKAMDIGPVIAVDVLTDVESSSQQDELKNADLVLKPDISGMSPFDFKKRNNAVFQGKIVTGQHLKEIKHLVGISENEADSKRSNDP